MASYDLSHLTQPESQDVSGPIQDDEALFLYALIRGMRLKTIFELGGLNGYSAINFLKAVGSEGVVFTCDINQVVSQSRNHIVITKNAMDVTVSDLDGTLVELIFFDCHVYKEQMFLFSRLRDFGVVDDKTIIALHDTNTHPFKTADWSYPIKDGGYVHQPAERKMVNDFVTMGYHAFCLHTTPSKHSSAFPVRHGLTVMSRFTPLET